MTERRRDRPLSLRRPDGPPDSHEPPQDEDLVDDNVIDLRPYLTREIADARAAHLGGAIDDAEPARAGNAPKAARGYLPALLETQAALAACGRLVELVRRFRATRPATSRVCDDEEA